MYTNKVLVFAPLRVYVGICLGHNVQHPSSLSYVGSRVSTTGRVNGAHNFDESHPQCGHACHNHTHFAHAGRDQVPHHRGCRQVHCSQVSQLALVAK